MSRPYRYRSYFWPAVLILVGIIALLVNTGRLSAERLYLIVNLWPVILIVIGLELIVRRLVHGASGDLAAALIILVAVVGSAAYVTISPNPAATKTLDASGDVGAITEASAEIDAGAATTTIEANAELGAKLFTAHIQYSGAKPTVSLDPAGALTISQANNNFWGSFQNPRFILTLEVNPGVSWKFDINTGASANTINLPHVHVSGLSLNTGASREEITLGPPSGIVPVEINSGAVTARIHRPTGTPVSVAVSGGAVNLTADGKTTHAIGSANYDSSDFAGASDAYRVQVNGGACTVTVDATPSD